jgi:signal transduction histidine kinase
VFADAELLKVALQNLLVNAAQAMDTRGDILVRLGSDGGAVHIDVVDCGTGIAPDILPRLFTPFFTTKARGTGLGLPTVRRIAEAHGGRVEVVSSDAGGTHVRFTLPISTGKVAKVE